MAQPDPGFEVADAQLDRGVAAVLLSRSGGWFRCSQNLNVKSILLPGVA
jgi:hypothetical protein